MHMSPGAAIECGLRDAHRVIGAEDEIDALLRAALDEPSRPLVVACAAVTRLVDDAEQLRARIAELEAQAP